MKTVPSRSLPACLLSNQNMLTALKGECLDGWLPPPQPCDFRTSPKGPPRVKAKREQKGEVRRRGGVGRTVGRFHNKNGRWKAMRLPAATFCCVIVFLLIQFETVLEQLRPREFRVRNSGKIVSRARLHITTSTYSILRPSPIRSPLPPPPPLSISVCPSLSPSSSACAKFLP